MLTYAQRLHPLRLAVFFSRLHHLKNINGCPGRQYGLSARNLQGSRKVSGQLDSKISGQLQLDSKTAEQLDSKTSGQTEGHVSAQSASQFNEIHIQMLSKVIHQQVFGAGTALSASEAEINKTKMKELRDHLKKHQLWEKPTTVSPDVNFKLPKLSGNNVDEHFRKLAESQSEPYRTAAAEITASKTPPFPAKWEFKAGWTRYDPETGQSQPVEFPDERALVFDVEVLMTQADGHFPTLATAVSPTAWYSWCSNQLVEEKFRWNTRPTPDDLIPLETATGKVRPFQGKWLPRLIIGHNVGFDRSFVKEQCYLQGSKLRFLDTMSMHIAVSGFTGSQRLMYMANKDKKYKPPAQFPQLPPSSLVWTGEGTMNNLSDVYQHYCGEGALDKDSRKTFISGTMTDVRENFQSLMLYCAGDALATHQVFSKLWPMFQDRFPHPVTLTGMMEMGSAYLPINANWERYTQAADSTYDSLQRELQVMLQRLVNEACQLLHEGRYKEDVWLWDLDWSVQDLIPRKSAPKKVKKPKPTGDLATEPEETAEDRVKRILDLASNMPKKPPHMPGFPKWYTELCPKPAEVSKELPPGPSKITTSRRLTPKLLRLTWDGYPLHYSDKYGWGYLVPGRQDSIDLELDNQEQEGEDFDGEAGTGAKKKPNQESFPFKSLYQVCQPVLKTLYSQAHVEAGLERLQATMKDIENSEDPETMQVLWDEVNMSRDIAKKRHRWTKNNMQGPSFHKGDGPYADASLPGCWFFKLPHKDGAGKRVGNPLSKDFLTKIEEGVLKSAGSQEAETVLKLSKMCSYWKNNQDRICSQMVVSLRKGDLPKTVTRHEDYDEDSMYGAIVPRLVTAGTVTRRAVEKTWLTASNPGAERVGSELKAMVQSPPGYHFVGADVDSQELWIAAVLGDAHFAGIHGSTALGWMTLQGNKAQGTDLHSKTAALVGISRDQAKIFNYGRIYGAGRPFAERLLMQFNHRLTKKEAGAKSTALYAATKGRRTKFVASQYEDDEESMQSWSNWRWSGGSESHMFNKLEEIAKSDVPRTPVLGCRISRALEPHTVNNDFMTSRVNWVVQSSAVDYLHMMLVCMRWLFEEFRIDGRFCISIHDEVRYLVRSEDRHRAALALQITNLLTRSMFAHKLGFSSLPQSVAFFSTVDIDTCLRKEVTMDCVTPSNPRGLYSGYSIPPGQALDIYEVLKYTNSSLEAAKQPKLDMESTPGHDRMRAEVGS